MTFPALLNQAIKILTVREHSEFELRKKLKKYSDDEELITQVVDFCQEKKYVDDERFTKLVIESLKRKGKGPLFIQQKLQQYGIEKSGSENSESSFFEIQEVAQKKLNTLLKYSKEDQKIRLMRFLSSRGFPFDISRKVIEEIV